MLNLASKSVERELLITVIRLQDVANSSDRSHILVGFWVPVVQRMLKVWLTIRLGKVNSNLQSNFAATKNVI